MGFLSKIKSNFSHGGVKVSLESPTTIAATDAQLNVRVTMTSEASSQQVNKVTVRLLQIVNRAATASNTSATSQSPIREENWLASAEYTTPVVLRPGQPVSLDIVLPLQLSKYYGNQSSNPVATVLGQTAERVEKVGNFFEQEHFNYEVVAAADVEGITAAFDPGDRKPIEILHFNTTLQ